MANNATLFPLESRNWSTGGALKIPLQGLPTGMKARGILLELISTVSNADATHDLAMYTRKLAPLFSFMQLKSPRFNMRTTGKGLIRLHRSMWGKDWANPSVTCTQNTTTTVIGFLYIPFEDPRSKSPSDFYQPTELLAGRSIELTCANSGLVQTSLTVTACQIQSSLVLVPGGDGKLPAKVEIDYEDWAGQTAELETGTYTDLMIYS